MYNQLINIQPLKVGGQKEVYSAEHPKFGSIVYKVIKPSRDSLERTKREIRATKLISSPYVPKILAHNCDKGEPTLWLVEERISGNTLRSIIDLGKKFTITDVVKFLKSMLEITIETEKNNLVHRDIKPDNIMVDDSGNFWLLDYGIARHLDLESITDTNRPFGVFTVGYASSEQFRNIKKNIDIRADLFSIGVVAHEMVTGENFYITGSDNDVLRVLRKLENNSIPPLIIDGDTQYQLSSFIKLLGDHRRTRRPKNAKEALDIFNSILDTLKLG